MNPGTRYRYYGFMKKTRGQKSHATVPLIEHSSGNNLTKSFWERKFLPASENIREARMIKYTRSQTKNQENTNMMSVNLENMQQSQDIHIVWREEKCVRI